MTVTDETILAYVDGELGPEEAAAVEAAAKADPELDARIAAHRMLAFAVRDAWADVADEPVPERLLAAARSGDVVDFAAARARRAAPSWPAWGAAAAALVAGLAVGLALPRGGDLIGGDMRARAQLASALEGQLASAPPADAAIRVGLTFRARDGRWCRTFAAATTRGPAGLACREADGWTVRMAVARPGGSGPEFRTAAAETPAEVLAAAEALMAAPPLEAQAEAAAAKGGWK